MDTQSIDYDKSQFFEIHRILCAKNIPFFGNVANLDKLPITGTLVIALPMKIKGGSGAPLRLVAITPWFVSHDFQKNNLKSSKF